MDYTVALPALVQNFNFATNTRSVLSNLPNLCGAYTYKITEAYTWTTVAFASNPGSISVYTTLISLCGTYPAHFEVGLASYPAVPKITIPFTINILNPCLATVLSLPTTPPDTTITALSGVAVTQTFAPAKDSVATAAGINNICGNRIYSIVEPIPAAFTTIIAPAPPANLFTTS